MPVHVVISSGFFRKSEANASEFLENLEDMFTSVLHVQGCLYQFSNTKMCYTKQNS